jgi:hypothetical protein
LSRSIAGKIFGLSAMATMMDGRALNQPLHRKVEYVGDDGEESCQIDKPSQDVLE